jgi:hypothetical protein
VKIQSIPDRVVERVLDNVSMGAAVNLQLGPCHLSTYSTASHGYAQVGWTENGRTRMVLCHQVVWFADHGPIADGMTVDHRCHVKPCIRLEHLRLLTNEDNGRRNRPGLDWPLDGSCANGHGPEHRFAIAHKDGSRKTRCRECMNDWQRAYRARKRQEGVA